MSLIYVNGKLNVFCLVVVVNIRYAQSS